MPGDSDLEKLLADMKAEYEQKDSARPVDTLNRSPAPTVEAPAQSGHTRQIKGTVSGQNQGANALLGELAAEYEKKDQEELLEKQREAERLRIEAARAEQARRFAEERARADAIQQETLRLQREAQLERDRLAQEEARKKQYRDALLSSAKAFLVQLDPNSSEGQWFSDFAQGYGSPLEAALEYLVEVKGFRRE